MLVLLKEKFNFDSFSIKMEGFDLIKHSATKTYGGLKVSLT
jgi:hypothetical protein